MAQGTVKRTVHIMIYSYPYMQRISKIKYYIFSLQICVGEISGDCGHEAGTQVRTCPESRGGTFWVMHHILKYVYRIWRKLLI